MQKAQSRVCDMRSRTILHQAHTPVMSKSLKFCTHWPANTNHAILIKYLKNTRKENLPYRGRMLRKNILLGDLFDGDL